MRGINISMMWNVKRVFIAALAIRLALAPFATLSATFENITAVDTIFVQGFNPLSWITSYGTGFYLFYVPVYVPYLFLNLLGVHSLFILEFFFKTPAIVGDLLSGYALYNLALRILHDPGRATLLSALYLLNPFTIFISAVVGHLEPLMMGLVLMSMYCTLQPNSWKSAGFLSLASTLRFLPGLLLPFFLLNLRRRSPQSARSYLSYFAVFSAILFSPYLLVIVPLGLNSQPLLFTYLQTFGGPVSTLGQSNPTMFKFNLTGFFASTGLWGYASHLSNAFAFLALYAGMVAAFWRFTVSDFKALVSFGGIFFSTFMLVVPLSQPHYLSWFLPFALIGTFVYGAIPRQYIGLLIAVNMIIWPLIDPGFLVALDATFPWITGYDYLYNHWPLNNVNLQLSLSVLYAVTLAICMIALLASAMGTRRFESSTKGTSRGVSPVLIASQIGVLVFEMLRLAYFQAQTYLWLVPAGVSITILSVYLVHLMSTLSLERKSILRNLSRKNLLLLAVSGLMVALGINGNSPFLLIQACFLIIIAFTQESRTGSMLIQIIMLWCSGYSAYLSLTSTNSLEAILTVLTVFVILSAWLGQSYTTISLGPRASLSPETR